MSVGAGAGRLPEKIGKYRIVDRIGRGGMGMIFKAHDPILDRQVAIKVISPEVEVTDELRARFFREAQACAKLNHPNIVTVYDMGEDDGRLFIVMELLEGDELRRLIAQRTVLPLEDKLSVMLQVCSGLHYAHQKGIVHRDMKPGNIFRLHHGQVKILDFGIAHIASADPGLTRTGLIMGTLRYISPEQLRGRADHRSDMFSIASVFYELLTSRPPFLGDDPMQLLEQLRTEDPPPPSEIDPNIPSALTAIVQRAMRKNPADRFHDLEEMRSELELVHGGVIEERLRVAARIRRQRERIVELRAALAERAGVSGEEEPIRPISERNSLVAAKAAEQEFAGLIESMEAQIARLDGLAPAVQRANELLGTGRFEDAVAQFETILADVPEHPPAREGLARARAEAEANRQHDLITDLLEKARVALDDRRYALCLDILKQATALPLPTDTAQAITALRQAAEAGLVEQETLRLARQQADAAHEQMVKARADAQAEDAAQLALGVWDDAEARSAAAQADLRREAYAEAKQGFDQAAGAYRRSLNAARQAQAEERRTAERARDMAHQGQNQARAAGAAQYARDLWDAAEARLTEAQAVFAKTPSARAGSAFTEASALYRRAEEAAREAREREHGRADAARERAAEGRRSAATLDAEHRVPTVWQQAVGKSGEGEAALLRQQYAKATEAFEAALALYHQAQAQVRELARRQREEARKKQQEMAERRRSAMAVEAGAHAAADWNEAEASAATGDRALAGEAWEEAGRAFDQAAALYRRAEEHAREALRARDEAEKAVEAIGLARRMATEAQAATYAPEALKEAEGAEARAVAALSREQFAAARPLFDDARRFYGAAARAAGLAAEAETRRLEAIVADAMRLLEAGDAQACLERLAEARRLRPGYAAAEALRARAQETLRQAEESARQAEAAAKRAKEPADVAKAAPRQREPARPVRPPSTAPTEIDDATTVLIRPSDFVKQPTVSADREDATVLDAPTRSAGPVRAQELPAGFRRLGARAALAFGVGSWRLKVGASLVVTAGGLLLVIFYAWPVFSPAPTRITSGPSTTRTPPVTEAPKPAPENDESKRPVDLPPKPEPTPPLERRKDPDPRVLEGRAAEARRVTETARQAAATAEAPKLAAPLWAQADTIQRRAEDAVKQQAFDRAQNLFSNAQKTYQDAQRVAIAERERVTSAAVALQRRSDAERDREGITEARRAAEQAKAARFPIFASAQSKEREGQVAFGRSDYEQAGKLFREAQADYRSASKEAKAWEVAALQQVEQARAQMTAARRAAEQVSADRYAQKLVDSAHTKEGEALAALGRSEYEQAGRLFREAQSDYQAAKEAAPGQKAVLQQTEQARDRTSAARDQAVRVDADRFAKELFDSALARQAEGGSLLSRGNFPAAREAYQDATERFREAAGRSQPIREVKAEADKVKAQMLAEKQRVNQVGRATDDYKTALTNEGQGVSFYERAAFKDAAEKFRNAADFFKNAAARQAPTGTY